MAVSIIDRLKAVDVADDQTARLMLFDMIGDHRLDAAVKFSPIRQLGQRIERCAGLPVLALFFERNFARRIVQ